MKTLISLVIDESGSMGGKEGTVLTGVNNFLREQKELPGEALATIATFAERTRTGMSWTSVQSMRAMELYRPHGGTALYDALGTAIEALKFGLVTEKADNAVMVVITDGEENSSIQYSRYQIEKEINFLEATKVFRFIYLGASPSAFTEAANAGFNLNSVAKYTDTLQGTRAAYSAASQLVGFARAGNLSANTASVLSAWDDAYGIPKDQVVNH